MYKPCPLEIHTQVEKLLFVPEELAMHIYNNKFLLLSTCLIKH